MRRRNLFDASSLMYAMKLKRLDLLEENYTQWLAIYEALNGIWKEAYLLGKLDGNRAIEFVNTLLIGALALMNVLSPRGFEGEIIEAALKHGMTAYDASYVVLAKKNNLVLITEDELLRKKANSVIEVVSLKEKIQ